MSSESITTGNPVDDTGSRDDKALQSNSTTTTNVRWAELSEACTKARDAVMRVWELEPFPVIRDWLESTGKYLGGLAQDAHNQREAEH